MKLHTNETGADLGELGPDGRREPGCPVLVVVVILGALESRPEVPNLDLEAVHGCTQAQVLGAQD